MGAVSRRTGITEHTLRAWERRFGFPDPVRLPSGHRRYTPDQVRQLLLISRALDAGHRAGDVVPLSFEGLKNLVEHQGSGSPTSDAQTTRRWVDGIVEDALRFDDRAVRNRLRTASGRMGVGRFLRERARPLIEALGDRWATGEIGVRHEHFISEILETHLQMMRFSFEPTTDSGPIILACLPDEEHGLGLAMVAAELASAGHRLLVLGPNTPIDEIVATVKARDAIAVGISVSVYSGTKGLLPVIRDLRDRLPDRCDLWIGGGGAPSDLPKGVQRLTSLDDAAMAARLLPV